uniref:CUE domain-containing protein n=1 Tax=Strigamia maritima TaxID=126957 RepID=T1JAJ9_STRMM
MASTFFYDDKIGVEIDGNCSDFDVEPLDRLTKDVLRNGVKKSVPALHQGWVEKVVHINYSPPENGTDVTAENLAIANEEWMDKMKFLKDDLDWLLQLPHHRFWSQAVYDHGLRQCLSCFLSHCPRYFDPPNSNITNDMKKMLEEVARGVFFVHLRMATYKENKSCHITPTVFGEIIYENFLFDIPKLMDLCIIYSKGNCVLLQKIIENIFKYQPKYYDDLANVVPSIKQALNNVKATIGLHESQMDIQIINGDFPNRLSEMPWMQLQDVIFFLTDICATLCAFLEVYHLASSVFNENEFTNFLPSYYDSVIPLIQKELKLRRKDKSLASLIGLVIKRINLIKSCCAKIIRTITTVSYIEPILDENEMKAQYVDGFLDFMIARLSDPSDQMKVDYLVQGVRLLETAKNKNEPSVDRNEDYSDFLVQESEAEEVNGLLIEGACASEAVTGVELQSLISQVKDLLPDLGDGFIEACLEYYNYAVEDVIHYLLEDSLPPPLKKLDRLMPLKEKKKQASEEFESILSDRKNVFDHDEFDVFNRSDVDTSRIHKGKREDIKSERHILDDKTQTKEMKDWYKKYHNVVDVVDVFDDDLYNDDYDDTYDTNDVGALIEQDRTPDELLLRRPFTTPRVLRSTVDREESESEEEEARTPSEPIKNKDHFVENPEDVRKRNEERWANKQRLKGQVGSRTFTASANKSKDVKGNQKGKGQSEEVKRNRAFKERRGGDHGRRHFADRKRSGGMIPSLLLGAIFEMQIESICGLKVLKDVFLWGDLNRAMFLLEVSYRIYKLFTCGAKISKAQIFVIELPTLVPSECDIGRCKH